MSRFALPELERRWLLSAVPLGTPTRVVEIEDRYLPGPRLRLRAMTGPDGTTYKLTQKLPASDGSPGTLTTIYLAADEAVAMHVLEAYVLRKTRASYPPYGVDVFAGALAGLVLAEAEVGRSAEDLDAVVDPPGTVVEVTQDVTFTGGSLARMTAEGLARALAAYGL